MDQGDDKLIYSHKDTWRIANSRNFEISLSIRIKQDAHIFLCEDENPPKSRCYWIMLGFNDGNSSGFRKCDKDFINATRGWPAYPCKFVHSQVSKKIS